MSERSFVVGIPVLRIVGVAVVAALTTSTSLPGHAATKRPTTTKLTKKVSSKARAASPSTTRATPKTAVAAVAPKQPINRGTPFKGWTLRGASDWPAINSSLAVIPLLSSLNKSIVVRQAPLPNADSVKFTEGTSVSGKLGLLVIGEEGPYWKVLIPVRPNETTGWVAKDSVQTKTIVERVVVELSTNTLFLYRSGQLVATEKAATGTGGTPTPDGVFFVKSVVKQANPNGGRGPFVLVLSAFSEVLNSFDGGAGAVGIHGTSAPGKLGQNVSHGCVRVRNETIVSFAETLSPGTPVEIVRSIKDLPKSRWTPSETTVGGGGAASTGSESTGAAASSPVPTTGGIEAERPPITGLP